MSEVPVLVVDVPGVGAAVHWYGRTLGDAEHYDLALVDVQRWEQCNVGTEGLLLAYNGPRIPGTTARPLGPANPDDFPPHYAGEPEPGCPIRWYEPPHPLALTDEVCDLTLEAGVWRPDDPAERPHPHAAAVGHVDLATPPPSVAWAILGATQALNQFGPRLDWRPPYRLTLLDYLRGQRIGWHDDASATNSDGSQVGGFTLSAIVQLSDPDDYEGGAVQLAVDDDRIVTLPKTRGTIAVFPSTTRHRVRPLTSGRRKSMTVFMPGPDGFTVDAPPR